MADAGDVSRRLGEILDELERLPPGPSPERFQLLLERDELRAGAGRLGDSALSQRATADIEAELASLRRARDALIKSHTGYMSSKGGNNSGPASGAWVALGKRSLGSTGIARFNRRISELEDVLERRRKSEE